MQKKVSKTLSVYEQGFNQSINTCICVKDTVVISENENAINQATIRHYICV